MELEELHSQRRTRKHLKDVTISTLNRQSCDGVKDSFEAPEACTATSPLWCFLCLAADEQGVSANARAQDLQAETSKLGVVSLTPARGPAHFK